GAFQPGLPERRGNLCAASAVGAVQLADRKPAALDVLYDPGFSQAGGRIDDAAHDLSGVDAAADDAARIDRLQASPGQTSVIALEVPPWNHVLGREQGRA